jgi:hypothetical protein
MLNPFRGTSKSFYDLSTFALTVHGIRREPVTAACIARGMKGKSGTNKPPVFSIEYS